MKTHYLSWLSYQAIKTNDDLELRQKTLEKQVEQMRESIYRIPHIADSLSAHSIDSLKH